MVVVTGAPMRGRGSSRIYDTVDGEITLEVKRQHRKTLAVHVLSREQIEVRVPHHVTSTEIDGFVIQRLDWIVQSRREAVSRPLPEYSQLSQHHVLGVPKRLQLLRGKPNYVADDDEYIVLRCMQPEDQGIVRKHLEAWYARCARSYLPDRIRVISQMFPRETGPVELRVRKMSARWGSCDGRSEVCINSLLMQKPPEAVDLVVAHELCHLHHFAHDSAFYRMLSTVMPDWRKREVLLR